MPLYRVIVSGKMPGVGVAGEAAWTLHPRDKDINVVLVDDLGREGCMYRPCTA